MGNWKQTKMQNLMVIFALAFLPVSKAAPIAAKSCDTNCRIATKSCRVPFISVGLCHVNTHQAACHSTACLPDGCSYGIPSTQDHSMTLAPESYGLWMLFPGTFVLVLLLGLLWGCIERRRRLSIRRRVETLESYHTQPLEGLCRLRVFLPACFFPPVAAAFNRADADGRECTVCDLCNLNPVAQYTTRQAIRARYGLREESTDMPLACCCTPCAMAQDTIELEHRQLMETHREEREEQALREEEDAYFEAYRAAAVQRRNGLGLLGKLDEQEK